MPNYVITGKLGAGKSLSAMERIRSYLSEGRKVATNLDVYLDEMMLPESKKTIIRLPDKPRLEDLESIGLGHDGDSYNENRNGILCLDECASWLNVRSWNDKSRAFVIEWFLHARKKRWDVYFLIQHPEAMDKQLLNALCEHIVIVNRLDRIPVIGFKLPRVHIAHIYYGTSPSGGVKAGKWTTRGTDLFKCYDTEQCFTDGNEVLNGEFVDMRAPYTVLSAWHLKGRYILEDKVSMLDKFQVLYKKGMSGLVGILSRFLKRDPYELATELDLLKPDFRVRASSPDKPVPRLIGFTKASDSDRVDIWNTSPPC